MGSLRLDGAGGKRYRTPHIDVTHAFSLFSAQRLPILDDDDATKLSCTHFIKQPSTCT